MQWIQQIAGIDKTSIKNEDITEAWRIFGEQTEWFSNMLSIFKEVISPQQIAQFLHYYRNMANMVIQ